MITKILIVDDSATQRQVLREMLAQDPEFEVVGEAADGLEALELCHRLQPDLVTMDIQMPRMNGYGAIRRIMSETPRPVVVLTSSFSDRMLGISFKALDSGALMVLGKPASLSMPQEEKGRLLGQLKAMAGVKVVGRRWNRLDRPAAHREPIKASPRAGRSPVELICLGASTGGPPAVQGILQGLSPESTPPIALVQHINLGFCGQPGTLAERDHRFYGGARKNGMPVATGQSDFGPGEAAPDRAQRRNGAVDRRGPCGRAPAFGNRLVPLGRRLRLLGRGGAAHRHGP